MNLRPKTGRAHAGFSLVEVALALGVAGYCLVAVVGLLPVAVNTNISASEQTAATGILSAVIADLRSTPPTVQPGASTQSSLYTVAIPKSGETDSGKLAPVVLYFDSNRTPTTSAASKRYRVTITPLASQDATRAKSATMVMVKVSWPAQVDPAIARPAGSAQAFAALDRN